MISISQIQLYRFAILIILTFTPILSQPPTAVINFKGLGISETEAIALTDRFRFSLIELNAFPIIERGLVEEILEEQGFQQSGCTTDECIVEIGQLIGAKQLIGGNILKVGDFYSVSARLIDIETGQIIKFVTYDHPSDIGHLMTDGMYQVALEILGKNTIQTLRGSGSIYISSEPPGAEIQIDGTKYPYVTPSKIGELKAGHHEIHLQIDGYSANSSFDLFPQEAKTLNIILQEEPVSIIINSIPEGASVIFDGIEYNSTPVKIDSIRSGYHNVKLVKNDFLTLSKTINVTYKGLNNFDYSLISTADYKNAVKRVKLIRNTSLIIAGILLNNGRNKDDPLSAYFGVISLGPAMYYHFKLEDLYKENPDRKKILSLN